MAKIIYNEVQEQSAKEAYDNLVKVKDTYVDEAILKEVENNYFHNQFSEASLGDVVLYGNYEQDANEDNGTEAIEWIVVEKSDTRVVLLSKYSIECQRYEKNGRDLQWESSSLREYLNSTFYEKAFTEAEREKIAITHVKAEKNPNPSIYNNDPGNDTEDNVYILSYGEYVKYGKIKGVAEYLVSQYVVDMNLNHSQESGHVFMKKPLGTVA